MRNTKKLLVIASLSFAYSEASLCQNSAGDEFNGGACFLTSHTFTHPLESEDTAWGDSGEIKEYHFHTYWFQNRPESYESALRIQKELIAWVQLL